MPAVWMAALAGGALIGLASALLLLTHGRIAGISGITGRALLAGSKDRAWRVAFIAGLVLTGVVAAIIAPASIGAPARSPLGLVVAGLLVGYGTRMGNGCTSGHGVCGLGRGSRRSFVAVITFIVTGAITATVAHVVTQ